MTATKTPYAVIAIEEAAPAAAERGFALGTSSGRRGRVSLRHDLGIQSFGVNAFYQGVAGERVIGEHDELGPGANRHEELYLVLTGSCTFTVDGETVDAPRGTALFVPDPASKRAAVANEEGTTVVVVGGRPGEAFEISPGEAQGDFFRLYREQDYAGALEACRQALELHPGNGLILYNVACLESLLGRTEEALAALAPALEAWPAGKELAVGDDDLAPLRDDPRYQALVA
jgi:tetratricopeptide (TPR) repeat protein